MGVYLQLVQVEQAFKHLKGDLAIRPIFHHDEQRIEAHIFIAFLAYCVQATLGQRLKDLAHPAKPELLWKECSIQTRMKLSARF